MGGKILGLTNMPLSLFLYPTYIVGIPLARLQNFKFLWVGRFFRGKLEKIFFSSKCVLTPKDHFGKMQNQFLKPKIFIKFSSINSFFLQSRSWSYCCRNLVCILKSSYLVMYRILSYWLKNKNVRVDFKNENHET